MNFCIITGINYLAKAITMYESLIATGVSFDIYYVCFDKQTYRSLKQLNYPHIIPIALAEVEDPELKKAKKTRSRSEYFFTLTPSIVLYTIEHYKLDQLIYIDADLYFFDSPKLLLDEMTDDYSVLITKHFPPLFHTPKEGIYCVQFVPFKNDEKGMTVLRWWRDRCLEWCFVRAEDGKWADQGYLNKWPELFSGVKVLSHYGAVGPWAIEGPYIYMEIFEENNAPMGKDVATGNIFPIVFFHFQGLKVLHDSSVSNYSAPINPSAAAAVYEPYTKHLFRVNEKIIAVCPDIDPLGKLPKKKTLKSLWYIFQSQKTFKKIVKTIFKKLSDNLGFQHRKTKV